MSPELKGVSVCGQRGHRNLNKLTPRNVNENVIWMACLCSSTIKLWLVILGVRKAAVNALKYTTSVIHSIHQLLPDTDLWSEPALTCSRRSAVKRDIVYWRDKTRQDTNCRRRCGFGPPRWTANLHYGYVLGFDVVRLYVRMYEVMCVCVCMDVCVCMYVCMCVCIYVYIYVCSYVCIYVCIYVCMYGCMYVCMYVWMYANVHPNMCVIFMHKSMCMCLSIMSASIYFYQVQAFIMRVFSLFCTVL
jgi:hypothetical protein